MLVILLSVLFVQATNAQSITVESPEHQFGAMAKSQIVQHAFVVKNTGKLPLKIKQVKPTCGCTAINQDKNDILDPGESTKIDVTLRLSGLKGKVTKSISVITNDPKRPQISLSMSGTVIGGVQLSKELVDFGRVTSDQIASDKVVVKIGKSNFQLQASGATSKQIVSSLKKTNDGYELEIKTVPPLTEGRLKEVILLSASGHRDPIGHVLVSGFVVGDVDVQPRQISVPRSSTQNVSRYIIIKPGKVKNCEVKKVVATSKNVVCDTKAISRGNWRIKVTGLSPETVGEKASLTIHFASEDLKPVTVPIELR